MLPLAFQSCHHTFHKWARRSIYETMGIDCLPDLKLKSKISVNTEFSERNAPNSWKPLVTSILGSPGAMQGTGGDASTPCTRGGVGRRAAFPSVRRGSQSSWRSGAASSPGSQTRSALRANKVGGAGRTEGVRAYEPPRKQPEVAHPRPYW